MLGPKGTPPLLSASRELRGRLRAMLLGSAGVVPPPMRCAREVPVDMGASSASRHRGVAAGAVRPAAQKRQVHPTHTEAPHAPKVGCHLAMRGARAPPAALPCPVTHGRTPCLVDRSEFATNFDHLLSAQICGPTRSPPAVSVCVEFDTPVALRYIGVIGAVR